MNNLYFKDFINFMKVSNVGDNIPNEYSSFINCLNATASIFKDIKLVNFKSIGYGGEFTFAYVPPLSEVYKAIDEILLDILLNKAAKDGFYTNGMHYKHLPEFSIYGKEFASTFIGKSQGTFNNMHKIYKYSKSSIVI